MKSHLHLPSFPENKSRFYLPLNADNDNLKEDTDNASVKTDKS